MSSSNEANVLLALGGNIPSKAGQPIDTVNAALALLPDYGFRVCAISSFYQTPAFPSGSGPEYVNAAARVQTSVSVNDVLERLHLLEAAFDRARAKRWGQRTLDIDLLAYDDLVIPSVETQTAWRLLAPDAQLARTPDALILPHPRLQDRGFVLVPLAEIVPDWIHPVLERNARDLRDALPQSTLDEVQVLPRRSE
ncbi:MAG: 2-amino-4-hydroxy-6-hydroxymethyldihydropteridine diphosphokinase [Pseudomonadota bacterium]